MKCSHLLLSATAASCVLSSPMFGLDTIGGSDYRDAESVMILLDWQDYIYREYRNNAVDLKKEYAQKAKMHKRIADEKFNEAQRICLIFPYDDKEASIKFFKDVIVMGTTDKNWGGLVRGLIVVLGDYGLKVYQEWQRMESLLREAEHHYDLCKFYTDAANLDVYDWVMGM